MMVGPRGFSLVTILAWGGGVAMTGVTLCGVALMLLGRPEPWGPETSLGGQVSEAECSFWVFLAMSAKTPLVGTQWALGDLVSL